MHNGAINHIMLLVYLYYGCLVGSALLEGAVSCVWGLKLVRW